MISKLKPWVRGAFELIIHAELHLREGGDFDRRIAHIGFDNAVEVSITTFLNLKPLQRQGKTYLRDDVVRWLSNYHTKLEFCQTEAQSRGWTLKVPIDEIAFFHDIRNSQYHSGGPGVPESDHLASLREAALDIFAMLFDIAYITDMLENCVQQRLTTRNNQPPKNSTVDKLLDMADEPVTITGQPYPVSEVLYAADPDAYGNVAAAVSESRNVVDDLRRKYPQCLNEKITHISFVHYDGAVYLKELDDSGEMNLMDVAFIGDEPGDCFFPPSCSPDENADRLVQELDSYSIVNCLDIFTLDANKRIYQAHNDGTLETLFQVEQQKDKTG